MSKLIKVLDLGQLYAECPSFVTLNFYILSVFLTSFGLHLIVSISSLLSLNALEE